MSTVKTTEPFSLSSTAGTDIWRKPPSHNAFNASTFPAVLPLYKLNSFQRARITFALPPGNQLRQYDQAGLLLHLTKPGVPENKTKWLKTGIEWYNGKPYISTVSCDAWSDWSIVPIPEYTSAETRPRATIEVERLAKDQNTVWVYWIIRDAEGKETERRPLRELAWMFADVEGWSIGIGGYTCRPTTEGGEGLLEAQFEEGIEFELSN